ncbi:MAG: hypothetical protein GY838_12290 [bacterium]|nr:hypothetical protein [bacterium]
MRTAGRTVAAVGLCVLMATAGCAGGGAAGTGTVRARTVSAPRPGTTPVSVVFLEAHENVPEAPYYPLEGLAGCAFTDDGTLVICDEKRGAVHGLDSGNRRWYEFDVPSARPYRPIDVLADGFKILVLDRGNAAVFRFELGGAFRDRVLDVRNADPAVHTDPAGFAMDRDGRMVVADLGEQNLLLLDAFLEPVMRLGEAGRFEDQFNDPAGLVFLADGSLVAVDRGNRRLALYGRLGFFESLVGGGPPDTNPFAAPRGVARDRFDNLFVADSGNGLVHVFDRRQRLLFSAGAEVAVAGIPESPVGVAVSEGGLLAVTDRARSAVLVYRIVYE